MWNQKQMLTSCLVILLLNVSVSCHSLYKTFSTFGFNGLLQGDRGDPGPAGPFGPKGDGYPGPMVKTQSQNTILPIHQPIILPMRAIHHTLHPIPQHPSHVFHCVHQIQLLDIYYSKVTEDVRQLTLRDIDRNRDKDTRFTFRVTGEK